MTKIFCKFAILQDIMSGNFGNDENILQICIDLDIWMNKLTNFQMTRFANSVHFVFLNLRNDYLAVQLALVYLIACKENRSRAEEPKCVIRKINFGCFV